MGILRDRHKQQQVIVNSRGTRLVGRFISPRNSSGVVVMPRGPGQETERDLFRLAESRANDGGLATLSIDILTPEEVLWNRASGSFNEDMGLLSDRIVDATRWLSDQSEIDAPIGYYARGTTAGAAFVAAARSGGLVSAIVSHQGRPELAEYILRAVQAATLFIVAAERKDFIEQNRDAMALIGGATELCAVAGISAGSDSAPQRRALKFATQFFGSHLR